MTFVPTLAQPRRRRRGFTLVEILVVIGIIVILAGILVPMIGRAMRQAKQTRTAADMQTIETAIQAFKDDHGDIPRTEPGIENTGAATLGRYLNGPLGDGLTATGTPDTTDPPTYDNTVEYGAGDTVQQGANRYVALIPNVGVALTDTMTWAQCNALPLDGVDGPGIRMRVGGKKYGPYIGTDKMAMRGLAFIDGNGNPILYFPARPGTGGNLMAADAYVHRSSLVSDNKALMKYDADDNFEPFRRAGEADAPVLTRIRVMLGDYNGDGVIQTNQGEKIVTEAPYLLWAAGTDGKFGPEPTLRDDSTILDVKDVDACDDVTNFR